MKWWFSCILAAGILWSARADVNVEWYGFDGFFADPGGTGLLSGGGSTVAMLVWTLQASDWDLRLQPGSYTIGSEVILGDMVEVTDPYATVFEQQYLGPFSGGYLYARIFDAGTTTNAASITGGLAYYQGPRAVVNNHTGGDPDRYNMNSGSANNEFYPGTDLLDRTVVPEPAVMTLVALGALALLRRRS